MRYNYKVIFFELNAFIILTSTLSSTRVELTSTLSSTRVEVDIKAFSSNFLTCVRSGRPDSGHHISPIFVNLKFVLYGGVAKKL